MTQAAISEEGSEFMSPILETPNHLPSTGQS